MRKIVLGMSMLLGCFLLISLSLRFLVQGPQTIRFYTILQNYAYCSGQEKTMSIDLYSNERNSLIAYPDQNRYFLEDETQSFKLSGIKTTSFSEANQDKASYGYRLEVPLFSLPEELIMPFCFLRIENSHYTLRMEIGSFRLVGSSYPLLNVTSLYGNYAVVENELHMVGISIRLDDSYNRLEKVDLSAACGRLEEMEIGGKDSELSLEELNHPNLLDPIDPTQSVLLQDTEYFIPIAYRRLLLTLSPCILWTIDGTVYCLDNFLYCSNTIHLDDYPNMKKEGAVLYAEDGKGYQNV